MSNIVAVDPGVATGWAVWGNSGWNRPEPQLLETKQLTQEQVWSEAESWSLSWAPDVIVCESYVITASTGKFSFQPASLELIGFLRYEAFCWGAKFVLQAPAKKRFMPDSKLRSLGWWVKGSEGHDNDALRHLGVYLAEHERNEEVLRAV